MSTGYSLAGADAVVLSDAARARQRDHRFFAGMALATAVVVFVGFAPSYYLRSVTGAPPLSPLVHLHGLLSTGWMLLFLSQAALVSAGRVDLHRRLGMLGAVLVPVLVVVGYLTAVTAARNGVTPPGGPPPLNFLAVPLVTILAFGLLAAVGVSRRRHPETHKRLMLLATIALLTPALARFRYFGPGGPLMAIGGSWAFVLACMGYDRISHGRIHPAFLWGGLLLMISLPLRFAVARTEAWLSVARWLTTP